MMNLKVAGQLSEQDEEEEKSCELSVLFIQFLVLTGVQCTVQLHILTSHFTISISIFEG